MKPRVTLFLLKYRSPEVETKSVESILTNTSWPYDLLIRDNRDGTKNMAKLWNQFLLHDCKTQYAVILDSDVEVSKGWLTSMMEVILNEKRKAGIVVPKTNYCNEQVQTHPPFDTPFAYATGLVSGFCFLINRDVIKDNGVFDEAFGFYGQDSDYFVRLAMTTEWNVLIQPKAFVKHLGHYSTRMTAEGYDFTADKEHAFALFKTKARTYGMQI